LVRVAFVQPGDSSLKHLGEAHMLLLAQQRPEPWTVCFEDRDARRFAEERQLPLLTTFELLRAGFDSGTKCDEILRVYQTMLDAGRRLPKGKGRDDLCVS
jgi:predicted nucleic acid-binding protein